VSGVTALNFDVPETSRIIIRIYDRSGAMVRTLLDEDLGVGAYAYGWDGLADTGRKMPPGVYYAVMEAKGFSDRSKLILVR
jgi:flagellar hook assembly protein FlgD